MDSHRIAYTHPIWKPNSVAEEKNEALKGKKVRKPVPANAEEKSDDQEQGATKAPTLISKPSKTTKVKEEEAKEDNEIVYNKKKTSSNEKSESI